MVDAGGFCPFRVAGLIFLPGSRRMEQPCILPRARPSEGGRSRVLRIWSVNRRGETWAEPVALPAPINLETSSSFGPSVDRQGTLYFASTRDSFNHSRIFRSRRVNGKYGPVEAMGPEINLDSNQSDPFITPDGRSLYFASSGDGGPASPRRTETLATGGFPYPRGDIYVSFEHDGKWTTGRHLAAGVNTFADESNPSVSPDGRLLFFTTERSQFTVPVKRKLEIDALENGLHSLENGHGNIGFVAVDALQLEARP